MSNYTKKATQGAALVFVFSIVGAFIGYAIRFLLKNNLSLEDFGLFYSVFSLLSLIGIFKSCGLDRALVKFIPEFLEKKDTASVKSAMVMVGGILLITNIIITTLLYFLSHFLSVHYFHTPSAQPVLLLLSIAFFFDTFLQYLKFLFQAFQRMNLFAAIDILRMVLVIIISVIFFKLNYGIQSPVMAYLLSAAVLLAGCGYIFMAGIFSKLPTVKKEIKDINEIKPDGKKEHKELFKKISGYAVFVMLTTYGVIILGHTDTVLLTYFSGLAAVGLYNIALPTAKLLMYLANAIGYVIFPLTSELWTKKEYNRLREGMTLLYRYTIIVIIPLIAVIFLFGEFLLKLFFKLTPAEVSAVVYPLMILSIGMLFSSIHFITVNFFLGIGKPQLQTKIIYIAAGFNLIGDLLMIPPFGIIGAAATTTLSYIIMICIGLGEIKKILSLKLPIACWIKTVLCGGIFWMAGYALTTIFHPSVWWQVGIIISAGGVLYLGSLILWGVISISEIRMLTRRILNR